MKAFCWKLVNGQQRGGWVTNEYKTRKGFVRHVVGGLRNAEGRSYRVEVHRSWDDRYKEPDVVLEVHKEVRTLKGEL